MVAGRGRLDGVVDEIPDIHAAGAVASPQPLLVLLNLACCIPVCHATNHRCSRANVCAFCRAFSNLGITDVRSDDEDDGEEDGPDDKED